MVKCDICNEKIETLFLGKIRGTYIKKDNKLRTVCSKCQSRLKEEIQENL